MTAGQKLWNDLPSSVKGSMSLDVFKKNLSHIILVIFINYFIRVNRWLESYMFLNVFLEHFIMFILLFIIQVFLHFMVTYVIKSKF